MSSAFLISDAPELVNSFSSYHDRFSKLVGKLENFNTELDHLVSSGHPPNCTVESKESFTSIFANIQKRLRVLEKGLMTLEQMPLQLKQIQNQQWTLDLITTKCLKFFSDDSNKLKETDKDFLLIEPNHGSKLNYPSQYVPYKTTTLLTNELKPLSNCTNSLPLEGKVEQREQSLEDSLKDLKELDIITETKTGTVLEKLEPCDKLTTTEELQSIESLCLSKETLDILKQIPGFDVETDVTSFYKMQ